jgi:hypothetical protein
VKGPESHEPSRIIARQAVAKVLPCFLQDR